MTTDICTFPTCDTAPRPDLREVVGNPANCADHKFVYAAGPRTATAPRTAPVMPVVAPVAEVRVTSWMNEWEIEEIVERFDASETPNLAAGAHALQALEYWTNRNSDGWPYWQKPSRAAVRLMTLLNDEKRDPALSGRRDYDPSDVTKAELAKALTPIKSFLTRQGVAHTLLTA